MTEHLTPGRYPGYDVVRKRDSQSWNDKTREVLDARLADDALLITTRERSQDVSKVVRQVHVGLGREDLI